MLTTRMGEGAHIDVQRITSNCFGDMFDARNRIAGQAAKPVDCWRGFDAPGGAGASGTSSSSICPRFRSRITIRWTRPICS
jgi:hypothetical protein